MAVIDVTISTNLNTVTYAQDDIINVLDGVTLTINSQWSIKPRTIQALGTGRIEVSNTSTTTPHLQEFYLQQGTNVAGFTVQQNGVLQTRGNWITVGTSNGNNNQVLFSANNVGGVSIDYPTMIQVETGNGTNEWEIWNAIPEDVTGGLVNSQGFNTPNITLGTVAVGAGGVVTGVGTNFLSTQVGLPFKLPGIARDFVIATHTSATSILLQELDGSTYTGGAVSSGSTYILRAGSLINPAQAGISEVGKVLFFNPLTTAVRMGNDINGTKIPTGARVRIPNIHFNSAIQQTTLATAISGTGAQNFTLTTAIGSAAPGTYNASGLVGTFLLVSGSNVERIFYSSRSGAVVSATGMVRGAYGTTAQASFLAGTTVYWIPANNSTNNASIGASPSGTVDMQVCSLGLRMTVNFSAFASLTIRDFGFSYLFNCGNTAGAFDINSLSGLGIGYANPNINGGFTAQFSALLGVGNIRNVSVTNNLPGGANSYANIAVANVQGLIFMSNLRSRHWGRTTNAAGGGLQGIGFITVKCATPVTGLYAAGSSVRWNALDNLDTTEIFVSALPNANTLGTGDTFVPIFIQAITDSTIRGIQLWGGGLSTRASLISIDSGSADVVFHNKTYPAFNGGLQLSSIISDLGLNTIVAHISISNPRITTFASVLPGTMAFNRGGFHRMLLIDSITATTAGSGANAKGGLGLDVIAGPHRAFQTTATSSIIPNLADVQPIVVMSNLAKTIGSVYVGAFSSQSLFDMYTFSGGALLDNLGRIYYAAIGASVIIKSVFPLRGITNFTGTAFDFNYNLVPGSNTIPTGTTLEFRMVNWGTPNTGAWLPFTDNASLETARASLVNYNSSKGINLQFRVTATTAETGRYLMSIKLPVTIDAAYNPPVSETQVGFNGAQTNTILAAYLNADPNNPVLEDSLIMTGSFGSIPMPYDYDGIPVDYRLIARLAGWTFIDITDIYLKTDISIPITQRQIVDINNNPLYVSGVTGVVVNHIAQTITVTPTRSAVQIWSAVQDNICLVENLTYADPFVTSNGSSFIGNYKLVAVTIPAISLIGDIDQNIPTDLTNVVNDGILTYNTNVNKTITITNCTLGTLRNLGTGIITINKVNSTIANYVDPEINFIDSTISVIGADTVTFHPTANDRDLNINVSGSFSASYNFKFGSVINGTTMSGTLFLRCVAGGIPFNVNKAIVLGDNLVDLGTTAQLASLNAKIDLTAKEATLLQTETDIVAEINANEVKIDAIKTKTDRMEFNAQNHIAANVHQLQAGAITTIQNGLSLEATSQTINNKVQTLSNYNDATAQGKLDDIKAKTDTLVNTDLSLVAKTTELTSAKNEIITEVNANETKIDAVKTKVDTLQNADFTATNAKIDSKPSLAEIEASTVIAKEATSQTINTKVQTLSNYNDTTAQGKLDAIKAKTDTLVNTDISTLSKKADTDLLLKAADYVAPDNTKIAQIKTKVDTLENYDDTTLEGKVDAIKTNTDLIPI